MDYVSMLAFAEWGGCADGCDIKNSSLTKTLYAIPLLQKAAICKQRKSLTAKSNCETYSAGNVHSIISTANIERLC